ncbi:formate/nitrite transporter family protein [Paenibacillus filicis]|uniref:Formate/nitrite transporter family protein n=1 Tax=Paenibacillus gyeongsangnamensis TaxID=3388067 RepID=A0ABT4Q4F0_9BACL|nr:formate/nitrite transporter family protein [Paenibacillus filicis]MCZ8511709.1 formate/nitrite transporter family protein [Paenibacillus filicis]
MAELCSEKYSKFKNRPAAFFVQSIMGGAMVAFGAILALSVSTGIPWPGLANLMMGLVFGFSLVIIMVSGASLITADMVIGFLGIIHRRITWGQYFWMNLVSYLGNAVGSLMVSLLVFIGGSNYLAAPWLSRAHQIAVGKTGMTDLQIFAMGCLCTWMLQTAVMLYFKARTDVGKILLAFYGPLAFVAGMTEHCIANIGFLALPILQQPIFTKITHTSLAAAGPNAELSWGFARYGWAHNQLFTLMGNYIGGTIFVGLILHFISDPQRVIFIYQTSINRLQKWARLPK